MTPTEFVTRTAGKRACDVWLDLLEKQGGASIVRISTLGIAGRLDCSLADARAAIQRLSASRIIENVSATSRGPRYVHVNVTRKEVPEWLIEWAK